MIVMGIVAKSKGKKKFIVGEASGGKYTEKMYCTILEQGLQYGKKRRPKTLRAAKIRRAYR